MADFGKKYAVFRAVNYKDASSMDKFADRIRYVINPEKSPAKFHKGWHVDPDNAMEGLGIVYKRYHPKGTRHFRHYIVSFGLPDLSPEKAFEVGTELAAYYGRDFPVIMGLHTDIPARLHVHFVQNTVNIKTGKKFSESESEFWKYRKFIHETLEKHGMPGLKEFSKKLRDKPREMETVMPEQNRYLPLGFWMAPPMTMFTGNNKQNNRLTVYMKGTRPGEIKKIFEDGLDRLMELKGEM